MGGTVADWDAFSKLPRRARRLARALARASRGEAKPGDDVIIAQGVQGLIPTGVSSLPAVLALAASAVSQQAELPGLGGDRDGRLDRLHQLTNSPGSTREDKLLERAAAPSIIRGDPDPGTIVHGYLRELVSYAVVDPKNGVREMLARRGHDFAPARIEAALDPVLRHAAQLIVARPDGKRWGFVRAFNSPVDLHADLLGG
jgi:hypothetical protein